MEPLGGQPGQPAQIGAQRADAAVAGEAHPGHHHIGAAIGKPVGLEQPQPRRVHQGGGIAQQPLDADLQIADGQITVTGVITGGQAQSGGVDRHGGDVGDIVGINVGIHHRQPATAQRDQMSRSVNRGAR